ncbi:RICIN domain-containing protein [Chromobacterium alticapitis]|uniref:Ricin B lectin domain-containing protein n=1 Tax=Chromobacterium alticapitis TaxID=2073169 RepID=A0A2S5DCD3_9NEIS|nr:RICIN domain-containing protein [Chromobacterium alticapitis]POZ60617.1 hypothetical protein C2I19_17910 [Chromobacterium alticapitis]
MDIQSPDLVFHGSDLAGAAHDAALWHTLSQSLVVKTAGISADEYYRQLFQTAHARLRHGKPTQSPASYAEWMQYLANQLGQPNEQVFQALPLEQCDETVRQQVGECIRRIQDQTVTLAEERSSLTFAAGYLKEDLGPLPKGTLLIRRDSQLATVLQPVGYLHFESTSGQLHNMALGEAAVEMDATGIAARDEVDDTLDVALPALSSLCEALSYAPKVGPVFAILQIGLDVVQLIRGELAPTDFDRLLEALPGIIKKALTEANLASQSANVAQFMNDFQKHCFVLKRSEGRIEYIKNIFLPFLIRATDVGSGTLGNTLFQLAQLWTTVKWDDIKLKEKLLVAIAMATGSNVLIYRTQVMLRAELAADAKRQNNLAEYERQVNAMKDAFQGYNFVANKDANSLRTLLKKTREYKEKRFNAESIYWGDKNGGVPFYTFYVNDKLDQDKCLDWCNFWTPFSYSEGAAWAKRTRDAHYKTIMERANKRFVPIIEKSQQMLLKFQQLALQMDSDFMLDDEVYYRIVTPDEKQSFDVEGGTHDQGGKVLLYSPHDGKHQLWRFVVAEGEDAAAYYQVRAAHSGQCLDIPQLTTQQGAGVIQWPSNGNDNQRFKVVKAKEGKVGLQAKHSSQFLEGKEGKVVQNPQRDDTSQLWKLSVVTIVQS